MPRLTKDEEIARIKGIKEYERSFLEGKDGNIAGVDEVGRGPFAGPVVTCAAIFPKESELLYVNDSKKLSEKKRAELYPKLIENALSIGIGVVGPDRIDEINIREATFEAMKSAIRMLYDKDEKCALKKDKDAAVYEYKGSVIRVCNPEIVKLLEKVEKDYVKPDLLLADGFTIPELSIKQASMAKGDAKCYTIAGASIIAKVTRDLMMDEYDKLYPEFGFISNKGYGTKAHIEAIEEYGILPIHRMSFLKNIKNREEYKK